MSQTPAQQFAVSAEMSHQTLAALLRHWLPGQSWSQVRKLVAGRRIKINGELWLDDARRLKEGDEVSILARPERMALVLDSIPSRSIDTPMVVVAPVTGNQRGAKNLARHKEIASR